MAESMVGLKRSHRCTEVTSAHDRRGNDRYGLGTEEQKQRRYHFR